MSIVVDLPAPFGPSSATISPARIETSTPRTALTTPFGAWNDFTSPSTSTTGDWDMTQWCCVKGAAR
jgi:hypothetical protein